MSAVDIVALNNLQTYHSTISVTMSKWAWN